MPEPRYWTAGDLLDAIQSGQWNGLGLSEDALQFIEEAKKTDRPPRDPWANRQTSQKSTVSFQPATIETERLTLRAFQPEDIEAAHRELYPGSTRQQVEDTVMQAVYMARNADDAPWAKRAVILRVSNELIGQVRLSACPNYFYRWEEEPEPKYNAPEVELFFAFNPRFWGKSYAYEASVAMIDYAFQTLKIPRLVNGTGSENVRSIALHKRLGFRIFPALPNHDGIVAILENPY